MKDSSPIPVLTATREELRGVQQHRRVPVADVDDATPQADDLQLVGLAFSGGGIRSATFNLGVLQALEKMHLLPLVDYLSTVSGGGYIGSWYLSCLKGRLNNSTEREPALAHLRKFSRYLAPQAGFLSADSWTIGMVWLRNTLLLQTMLVSLFACLLLAPRFLESIFLGLSSDASSLAAVLLFAVGAVQIVHRLARMNETDKEPAWKEERVHGTIRRWIGAAADFIANDVLRMHAKRPDAPGLLQITVVLPLLAASALFSSALWNTAQTTSDRWTLPLKAGAWVAGATALAAWFSLLYWVRRRPYWSLGVLAIGGVCGGLFASIAHLMVTWYASLPGLIGQSHAQWLAGLAGAPMMLASLGLAVVLQIGLLSRAIDDSRREWWSRLGAFQAIYSAAALALGAAAVYAPWLADATTKFVWSKWLSGSITLAGIAHTIGGLAAAHSPETGGKEVNPSKEMLARTAPFVFIVGLLLLVSAGLHYLLTTNIGCATGPVWQSMDCTIDRSHLMQLGLAAAISAAVLFVLAWRVDINEASMNPFYRNRLVRCYLGGASAALGHRNPNLFTGFDFTDDFGLTELRPENGYQGPVPIINASLNLTGADNAAMQERRATSFFFTPYESGSRDTGCMATRDVGKFKRGIRLGSCVATSGAAASPNMGYHTSAPVAFLMTFFNVRLGLWLRNPGAGGGKQQPRWGLWYLLKELFATADVKDRYVYLSDGGHFENLGVYELIRRRCRYIIACDAEQDENLTLEGLGNLVRKVRIDFDVEIDIDTSQIRQTDSATRSGAHCAVGRIKYRGPDVTGYLVYLKSSLTGDEVSDVLQYKARNPAFPHESTGDQFFSESQFESYRALGAHIVETAFARQAIPAYPRQMENLMKGMYEAWAAPSIYTEDHFARHAEQLNHLWDEMRKDPELAYLDKELFPDWAKGAAGPRQGVDGSRRRALYFGQTVLQLMENVYLDLHLEVEREHPDNQGWMTLFRTWTKSPVIQEAYALSFTTYGSRFRKFCEQEFGLLGARAASG